MELCPAPLRAPLRPGLPLGSYLWRIGQAQRLCKGSLGQSLKRVTAVSLTATTMPRKADSEHEDFCPKAATGGMLIWTPLATTILEPSLAYHMRPHVFT